MSSLVNFPFLLFAVSLVTLWVSAHVGSFFRKRVRTLKEDEREYFSVVLTRFADTAGPHYRVQLFDGHQPLRSAQEL